MDNSNTQLSLSASIEAILFYTAEPMSFKKLSLLTKASIGEIREAASLLKIRLSESGGGVILLEQHDEIALGTAPEVGPLIEQITREEISKELSKAAIETLAIICYKGPLTRSDVDYIRGVNSTFIIRNLLIRGIIEKLENPRDSRAMLYGATFAALEYMGVTKIEDLPQYNEIQATLVGFSNERINQEEDSIKETVMGGDADSKVLMCDVDNDGVLSEEECENTSDNIIHPISDDDILDDDIIDDLDADIAEENIMSPLFDDGEIEAHTQNDENKISL